MSIICLAILPILAAAAPGNMTVYGRAPVGAFAVDTLEHVEGAAKLGMTLLYSYSPESARKQLDPNDPMGKSVAKHKMQVMYPLCGRFTQVRLAREIGPTDATILVVGGSSAMANFDAGICDALGVYPYPYHFGKLDATTRNQMRFIMTRARSLQPDVGLVGIYQAFGCGEELNSPQLWAPLSEELDKEARCVEFLGADGVKTGRIIVHDVKSPRLHIRPPYTGAQCYFNSRTGEGIVVAPVPRECMSGITQRINPRFEAGMKEKVPFVVVQFQGDYERALTSYLGLKTPPRPTARMPPRPSSSRRLRNCSSGRITPRAKSSRKRRFPRWRCTAKSSRSRLPRASTSRCRSSSRRKRT